MSLASDISYLHKGGAAKLTINGELVIFSIRINILVIKSGRATNGLLIRPIYGIVRILGGNIERRGRGRKSLAFVKPSTPVNEGIGKLWGDRTTVIKAKGSIANLVVIGSTFKGSIEFPPTGTDAAVSRSTGQLAQESTVSTR
jgi:hypothetical protein